jgi:hypothetical protein
MVYRVKTSKKEGRSKEGEEEGETRREERGRSGRGEGKERRAGW